MEKRIAKLLYAAAAIGAVWLFMHFLLPWTAPLLLALAVAALMEAPVRMLMRHRWKRGAAAAIVTLTVIGALVYLTARLTYFGIQAITDFAKEAPELVDNVSRLVKLTSAKAERFAALAPESVQEYISAVIDSFGQAFYSLPELISRRALGLLAKAAAGSPTIFLFAVTAAIGTYFFSATFPRTVAFITAQLPRNAKEKLISVRANLKRSFGGFMKAQLILMGMTFFQLLVVFLLLGIEGAVEIAAVTAFIDALPVFGTGVVLLPWAAYCAVSGDVRRGIALMLCWAIANLVRNCAQAKLLGDQIGLDPIASLLAIYVGFKVWGVGGMLIFPIVLVTLKQLNDTGAIKLWKTV